jgi:hypothetical protein
VFISHGAGKLQNTPFYVRTRLYHTAVSDRVAHTMKLDICSQIPSAKSSNVIDLSCYEEKDFLKYLSQVHG